MSSGIFQVQIGDDRHKERPADPAILPLAVELIEILSDPPDERTLVNAKIGLVKHLSDRTPPAGNTVRSGRSGNGFFVFRAHGGTLHWSGTDMKRDKTITFCQAD